VAGGFGIPPSIFPLKTTNTSALRAAKPALKIRYKAISANVCTPVRKLNTSDKLAVNDSSLVLRLR
jgi:hypothetical protein